MNTQTKSIIKGGFFGAIVYAGIMAGFDYFDGEGFRIWRFIFNALFFGIFISLMIRYNLKQQEKKEKN
ncbi:hypothetical protein [Pontimicrobium sp. IMCC45349]|uniref:hypothetical protein n=1 Tax=Pontimicrobium sp. IMCC45349 TaxID=3391574 RepID=UPI0039A0942E